MQVSRSLEVLGSETGIPKGLKKWKILEGRRGHRFWNLEGMGEGVKILMPRVVGYGYFLESPNIILQFIYNSSFISYQNARSTFRKHLPNINTPAQSFWFSGNCLSNIKL